MLPTAHFFSGVTFYFMLVIFNLLPNHFFFFTLIVICAMIPDVDNLFCALHRNVFTHTPLFWVFITIVISIINPNLWFVIFPFLIHLFLDTFDYGIMIFYPISREKFGWGILGKGLGNKSKSDFDYFKGYIKNRKMILFEVLLFSLSIILFLLSFQQSF